MKKKQEINLSNDLSLTSTESSNNPIYENEIQNRKVIKKNLKALVERLEIIKKKMNENKKVHELDLIDISYKLQEIKKYIFNKF